MCNVKQVSLYQFPTQFCILLSQNKFLFQISDVSEVDSGQYTCQLVGEDSEEMREKKTEGTREEVEINVFHREKEEEEEKEMGEDNWKVFYGEKKKGVTEDMSRKAEEGGFREREAHLRESERGGGGEVGRSRVIFQKFQNSDLLNRESGDMQKEVDSRMRNLSQSLLSTKSTRNLTEPLLSTESMTNVTELSLSDGSRTALPSGASEGENLRRKPSVFVKSVASSVCKSCVLVFLCSVLFRTNIVFFKC